MSEGGEGALHRSLMPKPVPVSKFRPSFRYKRDIWSGQMNLQISTEQNEQQHYRCMDNAFPRDWSGWTTLLKNMPTSSLYSQLSSDRSIMIIMRMESGQFKSTPTSLLVRHPSFSFFMYVKFCKLQVHSSIPSHSVCGWQYSAYLLFSALLGDSSQVMLKNSPSECSRYLQFNHRPSIHPHFPEIRSEPSTDEGIVFRLFPLRNWMGKGRIDWW